MPDFLKKPTVQLKEEKPWPDAPSVPEDASELDRLTYPAGLLGHAVQYMIDTARLPSRWMALGTAIAMLGKGIDRKVIGPTGSSNVGYDAIIGLTGIGKQHNLNCGLILLRAMGVEDCFRAGGIASVQSIEELIEGQGEKATLLLPVGPITLRSIPLPSIAIAVPSAIQRLGSLAVSIMY